jgi:hypothetical protein
MPPSTASHRHSSNGFRLHMSCGENVERQAEEAIMSPPRALVVSVAQAQHSGFKPTILLCCLPAVYVSVCETLFASAFPGRSVISALSQDLRTRGPSVQTFDGRAESVRDVQFSHHVSHNFAAVFENGTVQVCPADAIHGT